MIPIIPLVTAIPATAIVIILMFLPALIELRKPQDAGPRLITNSFSQRSLKALRTVLADIEEELKFAGPSSNNIAVFLNSFPNMEA